MIFRFKQDFTLLNDDDLKRKSRLEKKAAFSPIENQFIGKLIFVNSKIKAGPYYVLIKYLVSERHLYPITFSTTCS
ncbi:hypothetical protein JOC77_000996 [Peribacillus deserti]|uniref:Uncharacterized protein n=1 Tax=Peribacillus deserti TaxID=673318 RepID=A0ABS2QFL1_9BACI|nr:hypothetical protein [Peribacillus deserti]